MSQDSPTIEQFREIVDRNDLGEYIRHTLLARGAHNENYKLTTTKEKYVVRIAMHGSESLAHEYKFLKQTDGRYGPRVFAYDESRQVIEKAYLIEEFLEGKHPEQWSEEIISSVGRLIKRIHESEQIPGRPIRTPIEFWQEYIHTRWVLYRHEIPENLQERTKSVVTKTRRVAESTGELIGKNVVPVHADIGLLNIILEESGIRLVDWEFVEPDVPEAELAYFIYKLSEQDIDPKPFLSTYNLPYSEELLKRLLVLISSGLLFWRLERIAKIRERDLVGFTASDPEEMLKQYRDRLPKVEEMLERFLTHP